MLCHSGASRPGLSSVKGSTRGRASHGSLGVLVVRFGRALRALREDARIGAETVD